MNGILACFAASLRSLRLNGREKRKVRKGTKTQSSQSRGSDLALSTYYFLLISELTNKRTQSVLGSQIAQC